MPCSCPKCGMLFAGQTLGSHAAKCNLTLAEMFWHRVNKNGAGGCWIWTASQKEKGYGQYFHRGKMHRAHRLAWTLSGLELPARPLELAHRCDNRLCVNPEHLFAATHVENMADCKQKGRHVHGVRNVHAKLTEDEVRYIRANYRRGSAKTLSAKFSISTTVIYQIAKGNLWTNVK